MTVEQIRDAVHSAPFVPFTLHSADGPAVRVPTPDHISFTPATRTIIMVKDDGGWSVFDMLLLTEIEFDGAKAA